MLNMLSSSDDENIKINRSHFGNSAFAFTRSSIPATLTVAGKVVRWNRAILVKKRALKAKGESKARIYSLAKWQK